MEHILFEHTNGIELFRLKFFEGLTAESYCNYNELKEVVVHVSEMVFNSTEECVDYMKMTDADQSEKLINFLKMNGVTVLHCDKSLTKLMNDNGIETRSSPNIMRGIRKNISRLAKTEIDLKAQIGAAYKYSRGVIKYDMGKDDNLIIVVGSECEQLRNEIMILSDKMEKMVRSMLPGYRNDYKKEIDRIIKADGATEVDIFSEMRDGYAEDDVMKELSEEDIQHLKMLSQFIFKKKEKLKTLEKYLGEKLDSVSPNLNAILGNELSVKIIHKAGGLHNLTLLPSSTVQLLGAEKSLFRSLKMKRDTPKYGLLYELERSKGKKGRISRYVAAKCVLAARIDVYEKERTNEYGKEMKNMIEKKIRGSKYSSEKTSEIFERVNKKLNKIKKIQSKEEYEKELKKNVIK